jgi:hypothetical protein
MRKSREIHVGFDGSKRLGAMGKARGGAAKHYPIKTIKVQDGVLYGGRPMLEVEFLAEGDTRSIVNLTESAALALIRALLERIPPISIAVDDELYKLVKSARDWAEEDAKAMVKAIKDIYKENHGG